MQAGGEVLRFNRIYAIAARKFVSLRRDKRMFGFIVIMPALHEVFAEGNHERELEFSVKDRDADGENW